MIVSIHQPGYLPWLGYFHRIALSDVHIVLDHVQFEKNSFTNRNKIRTSDGWRWLTVPVTTAGKFGKIPIREIEIANHRDWAAKHWKSLRLNYAKAPYFPAHSAYFEDVFSRPWRKLFDLAWEITAYLLEAFSIRTNLYFSSSMAFSGTKNELVLNLCRDLGASLYLSGPLGRDYIDDESFRRAGIGIQYHDYCHPTYKQAHPGFEACMAALDLLFNAGPASAGILSHRAEFVAQ